MAQVAVLIPIFKALKVIRVVIIRNLARGLAAAIRISEQPKAVE